MKKTLLTCLCGAVVLAAAATVAQTPAADARQGAFDALLTKGQKTPDAMTPDDMTKLLQLSRELGRPVTVAPVVRAYLSKRSDVAPGLLRLAAENAALAGDYRLAVARYKQMMKGAAPGAETTQAALDLYRILVDYTAQPDAALQFMQESGDRIRAAGAADAYDVWFLDRCYERRMLGPMAKRLVAVLPDGVPVDQERLVYGQVDRFLDRLTSAGPGDAEAIVPARRLPALIRGSPVRAARARFLAENLAYRAGAAGKDQAAVDKDFEVVLSAAQAYLDAAPKAATVRDIFTTFFGGAEALSDTVWAMQLAQKQAFFERAFEKVPEADRLALLDWNWWEARRRVATAAQWAAIGSRNAELFKKSGGRTGIPLITLSSNVAIYRAQSQFLQGAASPDAALINSLAASDNFAGGVKNLIEKECWYGAIDGLVGVVANNLMPACKMWPRDPGYAAPTNYYESVLASFARDQVFQSPQALFSVDGTSWALVWTWMWGGATPDDKSKFAEHVRLLDWAPYSADDRRKVFERVRAEVKTWADEARRLHEEARRGGNTNAMASLAGRVALLGPVEAALKQAEAEPGDPAKAPNAVCRDLAQTWLALRQKNRDAYVQAGRSLYQAIRDYEVKKTPYGEALLGYLVANRLDRFDTFDLQREILADQVALCMAQGVRRGLSTAVVGMATGRPGWRYEWGCLMPPDQDRTQRATLNEMLLKAQEDLLAQGKFDGELFNLYRGVRLGNPRDLDLIGKLIDQKVFQKHPAFRLYHGSATCSYMALVRNEFPGAAVKYPPEKWFDAMFIEEIRQPNAAVDTAYWSYGRDEERKVASATAEQLAQFDRPPLGYDDQPARYTPAQYWELLGRAMNAEDGPRNAMLAKMEAAYGTTRFDEVAAGRASFPYMPVSSPEQRKAFFDKVALYTDRSARAPSAFTLPYLPQVAAFDQAKNLTEAECDVLARCFARCWWQTWAGADSAMDALMTAVNSRLIDAGRGAELMPMAPMFWRIARETGAPQFGDKLMAYATTAMGKGQTDLAAVYSSVGLEIMGARLRDDARNALKAVKSKALTAVGGSLTVERSDRRYPIFAAQALYEAGKLDGAWEQYLSAKDVALAEFKELDIDFSTWLVERHIESGEYEAADALAQRLIQWVDSAPQGFDMEARTKLQLVYAGIAFARQEFPRARAQYERIAAAREFENTQGARLAELKMADIDRLTKHFDTAIERLEKLRRRPDPVLQAESCYLLALIKFDREDYAGARDFVNMVFAANMNHANARILEGKLNLKMKKLVEATEVRVGLATDRNTIIPGRPLKIQIEDRNLAVVGRMADIEVRVWTSSGDEEFFSLLPFGDSKTKFEGELPTALAPQVKGDHVLQVLGRDKVNYAFSDRFKKAAGVTVDTVATIEVISDAELYISSGKILSKEEQEERALLRTLQASGKVTEQSGTILSAVRADDEIKPGNPISVRVVDPDRSVTAGKDQIKIRAVTTSGDSVDGVTLEETDTHSGVFEGKIQTATAPATAFASDSEEGKEPGFAISSGNYPPWVALADNRRPKIFSVDLNNNLTLGRMTVLADVPGRLLKRFTVQTSMNGKDYTTVATWPAPMPDWDGYLRCRLVRYGSRDGMPGTLAAFKQYLDMDYLADGVEMIHLPGMLSGKIGADVLGQGDRMGLGYDGGGSWYLAHFQGVFYVPKKRLRTFRVDPKGKTGRISYVLTMDGQAGKKAYEVSMLLDKGLHQYDLYVGANRRSDPEFELQCDIPEAPYMARCPTAMFMPASRPKSAPPFVSQVAKIAGDSTNNTFTITFASNTTARLIRIGIADFEGDAPAIRRLSLFGADGAQVLPAKEDILSLRRNLVLEMVPGDRISVTYEDPTPISKDKRIVEAFMRATFYNAKLNACYVDSAVDQQGVRRAQYIPMRRFRPGDPICVLINDPDGDVSDAQDKLKFTARVGQGKGVELEALESSVHSGIFIGRFFPVSGEPQRPSELKVEAEDDITLAYTDEQNTDYGIPWKRTYLVEQAVPTEPELRVYNYVSRFLENDELKPGADKPDVRTGETMPVIRTLAASRPDAANAGGSTNFIGCPLIVEVRYPTIALSPLSTAKLYVQTSSALKRAGRDATNAFDAAAPGTLKYEFAPGDAGTVTPPPGYREVLVRGNPYTLDPLDDGRFTFVVLTRLGEGAETVDAGDLVDTLQGMLDAGQGPAIRTSYVDDEGRTMTMTRQMPWPVLFVRPDDVITVAFEVPAAGGQPARWLTQKVTLTANAFFNVMDQRYQEVANTAYVGERLYLRIVDPLRDTSGAKDTVKVEIPAAAGNGTQTLSLVETFAHSGIFKGSFQAVYSGTASNAVQLDLVPVAYGETVRLQYQAAAGGAPMQRPVAMHKGADGNVLPFTKRFKDPEVAVQTQFTIAEAFFELAKKHRELKQDDLARREIAQGKKLLEEAIRDYPETEERAHADYLLANLAMEYAGEIEDAELKKQRYMEAITRFSDLVSSYPASPYAPKSQFKKALAFEKLGQLDQACEEYVKLSYRYPENELVAETIARLGQYFMAKGKEWQDKANAETDIVKKERARMQMIDMFKTSAQVFGRLSVRFPDHQLAAKTIVLSAQCWIRAEDLDKAIAVFGTVIDGKKGGGDLIAQSMYWSGDCYMKKNDFVNAYRMMKKLTWDYPETTWAKYARGRLSEKELAAVEEKETQQ
jgi:outer membrane protein assembly factor BamD (BamD/ComL family)